MHEKKVVLDTCALLWLAQENKMLSKEALYAIDNASIAYVSAISGWEIALKTEKKELQLPMAPDIWFSRALEHHSLVLAPLDMDILFSSLLLPWHHKDPADRFIIATAQKENAAVITADKQFSAYDIAVIR